MVLCDTLSYSATHAHLVVSCKALLQLPLLSSILSERRLACKLMIFPNIYKYLHHLLNILIILQAG